MEQIRLNYFYYQRPPFLWRKKLIDNNKGIRDILERRRQVSTSPFMPHFRLVTALKQNEIEIEIESISGQIIKKYRPIKIILFGSAGRGEYPHVNDLDFLVIKEDVPLNGIDRMRELDRLIDRNMAVDMLVYRPDELDERIRMGDPFLKAILKEGRVIYG